MQGDGSCLKLFLALSILLLQNVKGGEVGHDHRLSPSLRDAKVTVRCIERERQALLAFKRGLVDKFNVLSSWDSEAQKQDCCTWKGVYCSNQTGHVTQLHLEGYSFDVSQTGPVIQGKMITPKLIELQQLRHLLLEYIDFNGSQIPDFIGSLTNLRNLSLVSCNLIGQIPNRFGNLTRLKHLDLSFNQLQAENLNWLPALSSLTYLDLSGANLSNVFNWPEAVLNKLPKLVYLASAECSLPPPPTPILSSTLSKRNSSTSLANVNLRGNHLISSIFLWLSNYSTSLSVLDLSQTNLIGLIPDFIGNMRALVDLDLSDNQITGSIPNVIGNMSPLVHLDLSDNQITSLIPNVIGNMSSPNVIGNMSSLVHLDLSHNQITSLIPNLIGNISSLVHLDVHLDLSHNQITSLISNVIGNMSSLVDLDLSHNQITGLIPDVIGNMSSLVGLDLSDNQITGLIPDVLGNMSSLVDLDLSNNQITGLIPDVLGNISSLVGLDLSDNQIEGGKPNSFATMCNLKSLYLPRNRLSGQLSKFIQLLPRCARNSLEHLRLSENVLEGSLNNLTSFSSLKVMYLQANRLSGKIPESIFRGAYFINLSQNLIRRILANLTVEFEYPLELDLSSNQIEGPIPSTLSEASYLDLSNNNISGSLSFLCASANMSLRYLNLSSNSFSGELSDCWGHLESLVMLDLSNNAFSGKIPMTIGSLFQMETLKLRSNRFIGEFPSSLKNCTSLEFIDLGDNKLSRPIPAWLGVSFKNLTILMVSGNHFNGSIPSQLCHLTHIQIIDFSMNNISGSIPKCLNNLTTLAQEGNSSLSSTHFYFGNGGRNSSIAFLMYEDDATFMWKGRMQTYKSNLGHVKRIDLSSNQLTGEIPSEITHLVGLISLNLSRNQLTGQIAPEIGNLQSLDSLDLSRNQIEGRIPTSLSRIDRLAFLDLSYNNLSGKIPIGTQLQGFNASIYAGNPQLCGPPLENMCVIQNEPTDLSNEDDKDELMTHGF